MGKPTWSIHEEKCILSQRHLSCRCELAEGNQSFHVRCESSVRRCCALSRHAQCERAFRVWTGTLTAISLNKMSYIHTNSGTTANLTWTHTPDLCKWKPVWWKWSGISHGIAYTTLDLPTFGKWNFLSAERDLIVRAQRPMAYVRSTFPSKPVRGKHLRIWAVQDNRSVSFSLYVCDFISPFPDRKCQLGWALPRRVGV